jgi:hypothetical protein
VDPIAGFGEAMKYIPSKSAKQPQDQQNNDDSPQHEISPFETAVGKATWFVDRAAVDLTTQQDENAGRDGEDRQNYHKTMTA